MEEIRRTIDCQYTGPEYAAAYLRVSGADVAFIEANTSFAVPRLLAELLAVGRHPSVVRYLVVTHVHLDHAGGVGVLARECPNATVLAHPAAARHLRDPSKLIASARQVYGDKLDALYGEIAPVAAERVREMADGESVPFGAGSLRFWHTRGHARHHFVVEDAAVSTVYTGDSFGLAYPPLQRAGLFAFPSTSPAGFEAAEALASLERILGLGMQTACLTHYGAYDDLPAIAAQLRPWIELSASLVARIDPADPNAEALVRAELASTMERRAAERGLTLTAEDRELLALDLDLNAQGLVAVAGR